MPPFSRAAASNGSAAQAVAELFPPEFRRALGTWRRQSRTLAAGPVTGAHAAVVRGDGLEFADHRPYGAGDDPRFVDWNAWARFRHLVVKRFTVEHDRPLAVLLDRSASMAWGEPAKDRVARQVAAALVARARAVHDRAEVWATPEAGGAPAWVGGADRGGGEAAVGRVWAQLATLQPVPGDGSLAELAAAFVRVASGRGPLVWITDGWGTDLDDAARAVERLGRSRRPFAVVQVTHPEEEQGLPEQAWELVDVESGRTQRVVVDAAVRERYTAAVRAHREQLSAAARARGGVFLHLSATVGPAELVARLRRADVLRDGVVAAGES